MDRLFAIREQVHTSIDDIENRAFAAPKGSSDFYLAVAQLAELDNAEPGPIGHPASPAHLGHDNAIFWR